MRWPNNGPSFNTLGNNSIACMARFFQQGSAAATYLQNGLTDTAQNTNNLAQFFPFELERPILVTNLWYLGGTVAAGNVDMGIYTDDGTRIVSMGSQTFVAAYTTLDITDTFVDRGSFYLALGTSNSSARLYSFTGGVGNDFKATGQLRQVGTFPLPASATFAQSQTAQIPVCGFSGRLV